MEANDKATPAEPTPADAPVAADTEPTPEPELTPEPPVDNTESSALGRKHKRFQEETQANLVRLESLIMQQHSAVPTAPEPADPEGLVSYNQVQEIIKADREARNSQVSFEEQQYKADYLQTVRAALNSQKDQAVADAINVELETNFKVRHYNDGIVDAELNLSRAEAAVWKKRGATPANPLKGNGVPLPVGGVDGSPTATPSIPTNLPSETRELVDRLKAQGKSDEWIAERFKSE